jgi:hypothetical protein
MVFFSRRSDRIARKGNQEEVNQEKGIKTKEGWRWTRETGLALMGGQAR